MSFLPPVILEIQANATEAIASMRTVNAELTSMEVRANGASAALTRMEKTAVATNVAFRAIAVATVAIAGMSVKLAIDSQQAYARMGIAVNNAKDKTKDSEEQFKRTAEENVKFGFTARDTAQALGTLTTATASTKEAQALLGSAMALSRYKHMDLGTASVIMARATQGSAKAFKELGITLDTSIPKQQAINKGIDEFNRKLAGQTQAYLDTFAGKLSVLGAKAELFAEKLGNDLIPILSVLIDFFSKYAKQILIVVGAVAAAIVAFKIFTTVMNIYKAGQILYIALTAGMAAAQTALTFATEGGAKATKSMAAAQAILNAVMAVNPYVAIALAVVALITWLLYLYKTNTKVHNAIIAMAQGAIHAIAWIIGAVGKLVEAFLAFETGPLKLLLTGLAALGVGPAKEALKMLDSGIGKVGDAFDTAKKSVDKYADSLDKMKKVESKTPAKAKTIVPNAAPSNLQSYTGAIKTPKATSSSTKNTTVNMTVYASNTNDIARNLSKAAKVGTPIGAK